MIRYGSTEAGTVALGPARVSQLADGAVGYAVPGAQVQTVDDAGEVLGVEREGILRVRTRTMADAYFSAEREASAAFKDGWVYPGDTGLIRKDGLLIISGRVNDVINKGGIKVAPEIIEEDLLARPGIVDAVVFSEVAADGSVRIWAALIAQGAFDPKNVLAACRAQLGELAPDFLAQVTDIPRNDMGKVQRNRLKESVLSQIRAGTLKATAQID